MENINLLIKKYHAYCKMKGEAKEAAVCSEFQNFIDNLSKNDGTPLKIKFYQQHADFLLCCITEQTQSQGIPFTLIIQILNVIFRFAKKIKTSSKNSLVESLSWHLLKDQNLRTSPRVIDHVIWLVGRCMQLAKDRSLLMTALAESKLIQICLGCPSLQCGSEKGIILLLSYMWKCGEIDGKNILNLIPNLHKFTSRDTMSQVLELLRTISLEVVKNNKEMLTYIGKFLVRYFNYNQIESTKYVQYWELVVTVALANQQIAQELHLSKLMRILLRQPKLQIAEDKMSKAYQAINLAINRDNNIEQFLRELINNVFGNSLARRFFIQRHQQIKAGFFFEVLSGSLPSTIKHRLERVGQADKALKLLICLKRVAIMLGLDSFYEFKFQNVEEKLIFALRRNGVNSQLLNLWQEVAGDSNKDLEW